MDKTDLIKHISKDLHEKNNKSKYYNWEICEKQDYNELAKVLGLNEKFFYFLEREIGELLTVGALWSVLINGYLWVNSNWLKTDYGNDLYDSMYEFYSQKKDLIAIIYKYKNINKRKFMD